MNTLQDSIVQDRTHPLGIMSTTSDSAPMQISVFQSTDTTYLVLDQPCRSEPTTNINLYTYDTQNLLDSKRADLGLLASIRDISLIQHNWDTEGATAPSDQARFDAEHFARLLIASDLILPKVSIASDGEINFLWKADGLLVDLGFYGDETYSCFAKARGLDKLYLDRENVYDTLNTDLVRILTYSD